MDFITVPLVTGIVFLAIYKVFKLFVCRRERIMLIEKMENLSDKNINLSGLSLDTDTTNFGGKYLSLRIGALLLGVGVGIFAGMMQCWHMNPDWIFENRFSWGAPSIILGGCTLLFGGLGLIVAFIVEMWCERRNKVR